MSLSAADTIRVATEIVRAGLASESIKLKGSLNAGTVDGAKRNAEVDAAYLDTLLKGIINTLS